MAQRAPNPTHPAAQSAHAFGLWANMRATNSVPPPRSSGTYGRRRSGIRARTSSTIAEPALFSTTMGRPPT
jgi:hypothetical protein